MGHLIPAESATSACLRMIKNKRQAIFSSGQGTLEYLLVLTAALLVIIAAVVSNNGPVRKGLEGYFAGMGDKIGEIVNEF